MVLSGGIYQNTFSRSGYPLPVSPRGRVTFGSTGNINNCLTKVLQPEPPTDTFVRAEEASPLRTEGSIRKALRRLLTAKHTSMGGLWLVKPRYNECYQKWSLSSRTLLNHYNTIAWEEKAPFLRKLYRNFGLEGFRGVPPNLEEHTVNPETGKTANTRSALACITLEALRALPNTESAEDGVAQLYATIHNVNREAASKTQKLQAQQGKDFAYQEKPLTFDPEGYSLPLYRDSAYSSLQVGHMAFVGSNGSLLIVKMPSFIQMLDILMQEPKVQQDILKRQPFFHTNDEAPWYPLTRGMNDILMKSPDDLTTLMQNNSQSTPRMGKYGWSDVHSIFVEVPIDVVDWVRKGYLEVLVNKPGGGADKRSFLDIFKK